jgi:membrane-bound lytic murein transglycosylase A
MADKLKYIGENFAFYEFLGSTKRGEILLTGYFEPVLQGSISHSTMFSRPLYGKPDDLLTISLGKFSERFKDERALKARVEQGRVVPYYTRKDIDGDKALSNRGLELVWIDPVDAFFLQIQGSGTVVTQKGSEMHLVYADKNGHRYEPVGKFLKDAILPKKVTMQNVERVLRQMTPKERDEILFLNPSYVFFKRSSKRAITALGVPATPGRTIAVDPRFAPKGALAFLQFEKPNFIPEGSNVDEVAFIPASRFVVDQDSGGAITGTGRADLFCGRGDVAKREAGVLQNKARLLYLVPR